VFRRGVSTEKNSVICCVDLFATHVTGRFVSENGSAT